MFFSKHITFSPRPRRVLTLARLSVALALSLLCVMPRNASAQIKTDPTPTATPTKIVWYSPKPEDFGAVYNHYSRPNGQNKQSWHTYYDWVKKFYSGVNEFFVHVEGWSKFAPSLLVNIKADATRVSLRNRLNDVGRVFASDWSKDNDARHFGTTGPSSLKSWHDRLQKAAKEDSGDGVRLGAELSALEADENSALGTHLGTPTPAPGAKAG